MGMADALVLPGFLDRPYRFIGHFDILAISSKSEQQPISVIEAMPAGLPVASLPVGDVARMVAPENAPFIAAESDEVR
ncbi:glycosyltransferase, partial [Clostridium perfringens]